MFLTFSASGGVIFTMKALIVVIMGGVGNLLGTLIAGLLLGLAEIAVARLIDPGLTLAVNFVDLPRRAPRPADRAVREVGDVSAAALWQVPADRPRRGGARRGAVRRRRLPARASASTS